MNEQRTESYPQSMAIVKVEKHLGDLKELRGVLVQQEIINIPVLDAMNDLVDSTKSDLEDLTQQLRESRLHSVECLKLNIIENKEELEMCEIGLRNTKKSKYRSALSSSETYYKQTIPLLSNAIERDEKYIASVDVDGSLVAA